MSDNLLAALYEAIIAPLFFSVVLSTAFYGVTCMQTFFYYVHYPDDCRWMKSFVAVLWALNTIHEVLIVSGVYKLIMGCLVSPIAILNVPPEIPLQALMMTLIGIPTQAYFIYRIYLFSEKNIVAPLLFVVPAIYELVNVFIYEAKVLYGADGSVHVEFSALGNCFVEVLTISGLSVTAAIDVLIAVAMTFLLLRKRNETGFASTVHVLQRLAMFAVNTGIWTALFSLLSVILMHTLLLRGIYVVFSIPLSSIYCNMLLANLNARTYFLNEMMPNGGVELVMMSLPTSAGPNAREQNGEARFISPMHLIMKKTTEVANDVSEPPNNVPSVYAE